MCQQLKVSLFTIFGNPKAVTVSISLLLFSYASAEPGWRRPLAEGAFRRGSGMSGIVIHARELKQVYRHYAGPEYRFVEMCSLLECAQALFIAILCLNEASRSRSRSVNACSFRRKCCLFERQTMATRLRLQEILMRRLGGVHPPHRDRTPAMTRSPKRVDVFRLIALFLVLLRDLPSEGADKPAPDSFQHQIASISNYTPAEAGGTASAMRPRLEGRPFLNSRHALLGVVS